MCIFIYRFRSGMSSLACLWPSYLRRAENHVDEVANVTLSHVHVVICDKVEDYLMDP